MMSIINTKFSIVRQTWKKQFVIRFGPTKVIWRIFFDIKINPKNIMHFVLNENPLVVNKITAYQLDCPDLKALSRGTEGEDKKYLSPKEGSFWNDTKATPSEVIQIASGDSIFLENSDTFKKFTLNSKEIKGLFILSERDSSKIWMFERSIIPE